LQFYANFGEGKKQYFLKKCSAGFRLATDGLCKLFINSLQGSYKGFLDGVKRVIREGSKKGLKKPLDKFP